MGEPMSRWIVTLPILAVGVSIGGERAASGASLSEALAAVFSPAQKQPAQKQPVQAQVQPQKPAVQQVRHRRHRVHGSDLAERKRPSPILAKTAHPATLAGTPPAAPNEKPEALTLQAAATISVPSWVINPLIAPTQVAPASNAAWNDEVPDRMAPLPGDDDIAVASIWPVLSNSWAPSTAVNLTMLFGSCACGAIGIYGLVALNSRRRNSRVELPRPPLRGGSRSPRPNPNRSPDGVARQKLFPHQTGVFVRGR
jgi:hypothetical protein